MFNDGLESDGLAPDGALDALADLERNTADEVKQMRAHTRIRVKSEVVAQPGNSSDRLKFKIVGVMGDISAGGCQILFPVALGVGDVYWLTFDKRVLELGSMFARCVRCRVVREDAFEAGFSFFSPIDVSQIRKNTGVAAFE
jgi:hypothetical protein